MEFYLQRSPNENGAACGRLFGPGDFTCFTLEDIVRPDPNPATPENEAKVYGETAIPAGRYRVRITWSPKFKKDLPILMNVPGFDGIRIHKGNTPADTKGCILVGRAIKDGRIVGGTSTPAFEDLMALLLDADREGEDVWITIKDAGV